MKKPLTCAIAALAVCLPPSGTRAASSIVVSNVWSHPATTTGVVYATIRNGGSSADQLIGAEAPGAATAVELHESSESPGSMSGMKGSMGGPTMSMKKLASMPVPAGGALILKPGGYHIMLIGLKRSWKLGDSFEIRFHFKHAGIISTNGTVQAQ